MWHVRVYDDQGHLHASYQYNDKDEAELIAGHYESEGYTVEISH